MRLDKIYCRRTVVERVKAPEKPEGRRQKIRNKKKKRHNKMGEV